MEMENLEDVGVSETSPTHPKARAGHGKDAIAAAQVAATTQLYRLKKKKQ